MELIVTGGGRARLRESSPSVGTTANGLTAASDGWVNPINERPSRLASEG